MGGIFMFSKAGLMLISFLCGYLTIQWTTVTHPFVLSDFLVSLVVNPLKFFLASLSLFIGVICSGRQIRIILGTKRIGKQHIYLRRILYPEFIALFVIFFFLFRLGWEQTLVFFSLSIVYGIISVKQ